jgi:hypothetical protein
MTPEGKVKARLDRVLSGYGDDLHIFKPVQNGMGSPALDYIICYKGRYASIETKAGDKQFTPRQKLTADRLQLAGAAVFLVNETTGTRDVEKWLNDTGWRD